MEFIRHLIPVIRRTGRAYPALERDLHLLSTEAQRELLLLLREQADAVHAAERKGRMGLMGRF